MDEKLLKTRFDADNKIYSAIDKLLDLYQELATIDDENKRVLLEARIATGSKIIINMYKVLPCSREIIVAITACLINVKHEKFLNCSDSQNAQLNDDLKTENATALVQDKEQKTVKRQIGFTSNF